MSGDVTRRSRRKPVSRQFAAVDGKVVGSPIIYSFFFFRLFSMASNPVVQPPKYTVNSTNYWLYNRGLKLTEDIYFFTLLLALFLFYMQVC